jgi:hypothetical protein
MTEDNETAADRLYGLIHGVGCNVACLLDLLSEHPDIEGNNTLMGAMAAIKKQHMGMLNSMEEVLDNTIDPAA